MFRKKNSLLRLCSIFLVLFFFCVIDSGAQVRTTVDKSKISDSMKEAVAEKKPIAAAPTINTQPSNMTVNEGAVATFTVTATGSDLTYQWQTTANKTLTWGNLGNTVPYSGVATNKLTISNTGLGHSGNQYRCVVTNSNGTVTSNTVTLTVKINPPVITTHPVNATSINRDSVVFTVVATGSDLTYNWQRLPENSTTWVNLGDVVVKPGAALHGGTSTNKLTLSAETILYDNSQFRCVVTNGGGSVNSNTAKLTVQYRLFTRILNFSNEPGQAKNLKGDNDVGTKKGEKTSWELQVEIVPADKRGSAYDAVELNYIYTVKEDKKDYTTLELRGTKKIKSEYSYVKIEGSTKQTIKGSIDGQQHGFVKVLSTTDNGLIRSLEVKIDSSKSDDREEIGFKGELNFAYRSSIY